MVLCIMDDFSDEEEIKSTRSEFAKSDEQLVSVDEGEHMDAPVVYEEEEDPNIDPIERITKRALRMGDLSYDRAFAIDNYNLGRKLGEYTMARLFEIFVDRVFKDTDEWFSYIFSPVNREDLCQNLADYLLQRLGGEPYYSKNRGVPALVLAHMHIALTPQVAERWMEHFEEALYDMHDEMAEADKEMIKDHMRFQAYFLVAAQLLQKEHSSKGVQFLD